MRIYDATISYAGLVESDKVDLEQGEGSDDEETDEAQAEGSVRSKPPANPPPAPPQGKVNLMAGERELTTGLLAKEASFRLIVSGKIGVKEIERLIQKLEIDKEILADQEGDANIEAAN